MITDRIFESFDKLNSILTANNLVDDNFKKLSKIFHDKENSLDLSIILYGVYNAGKSSLINALLGKDVASVGDSPETYKISDYEWNNVIIKDTPGIDAKIEHDEVTAEILLKCDAVIYVVNPKGVIEENETLQSLVEVLRNKKKVFLVFNRKDELSQEDFIRIKEKTCKRLQELDPEINLQQIPMMLVNVNTAIKGKAKNSRLLIESSGIVELENKLSEFILNIDTNNILERLKFELKEYLEYKTKSIGVKSNDSVSSIIESLLLELNRTYKNEKDNILSLINTKSLYLYDSVKSILTSNNKNNDEKDSEINRIYENSINEVIERMSNSMEMIKSKLETDVDYFINKTNSFQGTTHLNESSLRDSENEHSDYDYKEVISNVKTAFNTISSGLTEDMVVEALKLTKDWVPSLMKGIGPVTMGKIASNLVSKYIPIIGTSITIISSLFDIFGTSKEDEEMAREVEQQREKYERALKAIDDASNDIANNFKKDMNRCLDENFESWFMKAKSELQKKFTASKEEEQITRNILNDLNEIYSNL